MEKYRVLRLISSTVITCLAVSLVILPLFSAILYLVRGYGLSWSTIIQIVIACTLINIVAELIKHVWNIKKKK